MTDIRDQLAQIRSILDDIDRDLSPRALKGQEDYDAILAIIDHPCPAEYTCKECAFGNQAGDGCMQGDIRKALENMRGSGSE